MTTYVLRRHIGTASFIFVSLCIVALCASCASTPTQPVTAVDTSNVTIAPGDVVTLTVWGMSCPKCVSNVDQLVGEVPGVTGVHTNMSSGIVTLQTGTPGPAPALIEAAIENAGFTLMKLDVTGGSS